MRFALVQGVSCWGGCERVWIPSSSAFIRRKGGEELIGVGGWRAYCVIDNGERIGNMTHFLHYRFWELGEGRIVVGSAGQRLDRSLIDKSVSVPEHLDFVAVPQLGDGLERFAPEPQFIGPAGLTLSTAALGTVQPYKEWKEGSQLYKAAYAAQEGLARLTTDKAAEGLGVSKKALWSIHERSELPPDWPIKFGDGSSLSVSFLLDHGEEFHGATCCDPLEPSYDSYREVGMIFIDGGTPGIWSFARGGRWFALQEKIGTVNVRESDQFRGVKDALEMLRKDGRTYQDRSGTLMLYVSRDSGIQSATVPWLEAHLAGSRIGAGPISRSKVKPSRLSIAAFLRRSDSARLLRLGTIGFQSWKAC